MSTAGMPSSRTEEEEGEAPIVETRLRCLLYKCH